MKNGMGGRSLGRWAWVRSASLVLAAVAAAAIPAGAQQTPVTAPQPTVPEFYTLEGEFVRIAYNNEGFATLGYRMAQEQVGQEWMLLQVGVTLRKPTKDQKLKREAITVKTPDGKTIPLASQQDYQAAGGQISSLNERAKVIVDSINYFPADVTRGCSLGFFADAQGRALAWDEVDLSYNRACLGRLYFQVPGGVKDGQHWLVIQFAGSTVEVPFRIMTREERKALSGKWEDLKKQHEAAFGR